MHIGVVMGVCVVFALLGGCSTISKTAAEENRPTIASATFGEGVQKPGAIYVWNPYHSAAVVDNEGNRCVLAASGAKTFQAESEAGVKLGGLEKLLGATTLDASQKEKLIEAFTKLSQQDADGAFADIALFHLCMLDQNGTFGAEKDTGQPKPKAESMMQAFLKTIEIARSRSAKPAAAEGD